MPWGSLQDDLLYQGSKWQILLKSFSSFHVQESCMFLTMALVWVLEWWWYFTGNTVPQSVGIQGTSCNLHLDASSIIFSFVFLQFPFLQYSSTFSHASIQTNSAHLHDRLNLPHLQCLKYWLCQAWLFQSCLTDPCKIWPAPLGIAHWALVSTAIWLYKMQVKLWMCQQMSVLSTPLSMATQLQIEEGLSIYRQAICWSQPQRSIIIEQLRPRLLILALVGHYQLLMHARSPAVQQLWQTYRTAPSLATLHFKQAVAYTTVVPTKVGQIRFKSLTVSWRTARMHCTVCSSVLL